MADEKTNQARAPFSYAEGVLLLVAFALVSVTFAAFVALVSSYNSILSLPIASMPWILGFAGTLYGAIAAGFGATLIVFAARLYRSGGRSEAGAASRMFSFSIVYLFTLFALLLADAAVMHGQAGHSGLVPG